MTDDNPIQKARTDKLKGMIDDRLAELDETIRLRRDKGFDAAKEVVLADRGKRRMDEVRRLMGEMEAAEQTLLGAARRSSTRASAARWAWWSSWPASSSSRSSCGGCSSSRGPGVSPRPKSPRQKSQLGSSPAC
jgi:hypothetical protein